jgi:hypothetical protein
LEELAIKGAVVGGCDVGSFVYRSSGNPVTAYAQEEPPEREATCHANHNPMAGTRSDFPHFVVRSPGRLFIDYKFECLLGVGHFTPLEATDKFAAAIKERLKG